MWWIKGSASTSNGEFFNARLLGLGFATAINMIVNNFHYFNICTVLAIWFAIQIVFLLQLNLVARYFDD
jgi:hypothetical protein